MLKTLTLSILLLIFFCSAFSQVGGTDQLKDSLKHELVLAKNDTSRVLIMAELAKAYTGFNSDTTNLYGYKALELAQRIDFFRGEASALNSLGIGFQMEGDYPKSLEYLYRAVQIAEEKNYVFETAACYSFIGNGYWFLGDYSKAVDFAKKSQDLFRTIIHRNGVSEWMRFNTLLTGQAYLEYQLDSSYTYLLQYYDTTLHDKFWHPVASYSLGDCLFRRGDRITSYRYVRDGIAGAIVTGDYLTQAEACTTISGFFKIMQEPDSAIYYAHGGLRASDAITYALGIYKNSKLLAEQYEALNVKEALHYRKIYDSLNESMYGAKKVQDLQKTLAEEQHRQQQIQVEQIDKENRLKQYGYLSGLASLLVVALLLYINNLQKKKSNILMQRQKEKVESTLTELKSTQAQLIQSEKMASLGELTAGIAHEIQNPLNFVNNFSEVNNELIIELDEAASYEQRDSSNEADILLNIKENSKKILHHGKRADAIVKSMLQHSRGAEGSYKKEPTDINALADEYLRLAYHSFQSKNKGFETKLNLQLDSSLPLISVIPQDIGRVLLNLFNNAFWACAERSLGAVNEKEENLAARLPDRQGLSEITIKDQRGLSVDESNLAGSIYPHANSNRQGYSPSVTLTTKNLSDKIEIRIHDNGSGIPQNIIDKIFQPFFTTKPAGQGTGLGLSLAYDIVKAHGGELKVESKEYAGAEFIILLPII